MGSGPYKVGLLRQGDYITYVKRDDYWAKDLNVNRGIYNFAEIRLEYFRDRTAELEALKAGALDLREEFSAKSWSTEYNLKAVSGRPSQDRDAARRDRHRRPGLFPQHAPPHLRRPAGA